MPVRWKCPGHPYCTKTYTYVKGMKAHIPACIHAQKKEVRQKKHEIETMMSIIQFVEDQQKGNVTLARTQAPSFRWEPHVFTRTCETAKWSRRSPEKLRLGARPLLREFSRLS